MAWYGAVINAYHELWAGHARAHPMSPVGREAVDELEQRLASRLPASLRRYHETFGALSLAEQLCSVEEGHNQIQPLREAFPGIVDIAEDREDGAQILACADMLVAFGDYLGNGNMFCFHRNSGEVYYFDHDDGEPLTLFFPDVETYLDALMIRNLAEIHEADEEGEDLLIQRFGRPLVRKWLY